jgi:hypothetical protein
MQENRYIIEEWESVKLLQGYWGSLSDEGKIIELLSRYPRYIEKEDYTLWEE